MSIMRKNDLFRLEIEGKVHHVNVDAVALNSACDGDMSLKGA